MHIADIILLVFIVILAIKGFLKGMIREVFGLLGLILGLIFAVNFSINTGLMVTRYIKLNLTTAEIIAFTFIFFSVYIVILLIGILISKFIKKIDLGFLDRIIGFIFGAVKAILMIIIIAFFVYNIPLLRGISKEMQENSTIYSYATYIITNKNITNQIYKEIKHFGGIL